MRKRPVALVYGQKLWLGFRAGGEFVYESADASGFVTPDGALSDAASFAGCLRGLADKLAIRNKNVNLVISTPECAFRFIKIPRMTKKDAAGFFNLNAGSYFNNAEGLTVSYAAYGDGKLNDMFLAALPETLAASYAKAAALSGLKLVKLDVYENAAAALCPRDGSSLVAALSGETLRVMFCEGGRPVAAKNINARAKTRNEIEIAMRLNGVTKSTPVYTADAFELIAPFFSGSKLSRIDLPGLLGSYE